MGGKVGGQSGRAGGGGSMLQHRGGKVGVNGSGTITQPICPRLDVLHADGPPSHDPRHFLPGVC